MKPKQAVLHTVTWRRPSNRAVEVTRLAARRLVLDTGCSSSEGERGGLTRSRDEGCRLVEGGGERGASERPVGVAREWSKRDEPGAAFAQPGRVHDAGCWASNRRERDRADVAACVRRQHGGTKQEPPRRRRGDDATMQRPRGCRAVSRRLCGARRAGRPLGRGGREQREQGELDGERRRDDAHRHGSAMRRS